MSPVWGPRLTSSLLPAQRGRNCSLPHLCAQLDGYWLELGHMPLPEPIVWLKRCSALIGQSWFTQPSLQRASERWGVRIRGPKKT